MLELRDTGGSCHILEVGFGAFTFVGGRSLISNLRLPMEVLQRMTASSLLFTWSRQGQKQFASLFGTTVWSHYLKTNKTSKGLLCDSTGDLITSVIKQYFFARIFEVVFCGLTFSLVFSRKVMASFGSAAQNKSISTGSWLMCTFSRQGAASYLLSDGQRRGWFPWGTEGWFWKRRHKYHIEQKQENKNNNKKKQLTVESIADSFITCVQSHWWSCRRAWREKKCFFLIDFKII